MTVNHLRALPAECETRDAEEHQQTRGRLRDRSGLPRRKRGEVASSRIFARQPLEDGGTVPPAFSKPDQGAGVKQGELGIAGIPHFGIIRKQVCRIDLAGKRWKFAYLTAFLHRHDPSNWASTTDNDYCRRELLHVSKQLRYFPRSLTYIQRRAAVHYQPDDSGQN